MAYAFNIFTGTFDYYQSTSIGGSITGATAGSILIVNSGPVVGEDNANLFHDSTNHTTGFGTTRTGAISGTNPRIRVKGSGNSSSTASFETYSSTGESRAIIYDNGQMDFANAAQSIISVQPQNDAIKFGYWTGNGVTLTIGRQGQFDIAKFNNHLDSPGVTEAIPISFPANTFTVQGTYATQRIANFAQYTLTSGSAQTITDAATVNIAGAPIQAGSVIITNTWALRIAAGNISTAGIIGKYNNVSTAGWGVPAIYAAGRLIAQTAAVASVATCTVGAADGSFEVSANVLVTTSTVHSFTVTVAYTDEGNTARVATMDFILLGGTSATSITNAQGAIPYEGTVRHFRCKAGTAITVATTGTFTTVTYNVEGIIKQVA